MRTGWFELAFMSSPVVELKFVTHIILNTSYFSINPVSIFRTVAGVESFILFKHSRKNVTTSGHTHSIEIPFTFRTLVIEEAFISFRLVSLIFTAVFFNKWSNTTWLPV